MWTQPLECLIERLQRSPCGPNQANDHCLWALKVNSVVLLSLSVTSIPFLCEQIQFNQRYLFFLFKEKTLCFYSSSSLSQDMTVPLQGE